MMDEQENNKDKLPKHGTGYRVTFCLTADEYKQLQKMRKKLDPFKCGSFHQFLKSLIIRWAKSW